MDNSLLIQKQVKDNAEDLQKYVKELKLWEEEMKRKDRQLSNESIEEALPPVRRPKVATKTPTKEVKNDSSKKKLSSYDYSSWDKFDVEKACEEIDNEDNQNRGNEENSHELAAQEEKYLKEKALYEKELGNKYVKSGKWDEAIACYTRAIEAYSRDPVFFANRALCYLKNKKYDMVETDCTTSLKLDGTYVKAMLRRAAAREALGRTEDACYDLRSALKLEPNNVQALKDLDRVKELQNNKIIASTVSCKEDLNKTYEKPSLQNIASAQVNFTSSSSSNSSLGRRKVEDLVTKERSIVPEWEPCSIQQSIIQPINKPPHLRSKKNLKRIEIYDIGPGCSHHVCGRKMQNPETPSSLHNVSSGSTSSRDEAEAAAAGSAVKPRSILTMTSPTAHVPPPPTTSVQFHSAWAGIKSNPSLRYRFLKQIPGESLADIFKESLESGMFSSIVETLATEFTRLDEPVLSYLRGLTRVRRFSTLALFMSSTDKSNLIKLLDHSISKEGCSQEDVDELRRLYELR